MPSKERKFPDLVALLLVFCRSMSDNLGSMIRIQLPLPGRSTQLFRYVDSRQYNLGIPVVMYQ